MSVKSTVLEAAVISTLVFFAAAALTPLAASGEEAASRDFTHTVFGESGSRTT